MAQTEIDGTILKVMDQEFAMVHGLLNQAALRSNDSANFIHEQARLHHLNSSALVGAAAAQRLEKDALAGEILQQRSAGQQPQASGGPGGG